MHTYLYVLLRKQTDEFTWDEDHDVTPFIGMDSHHPLVNQHSELENHHLW